MPRTRIRCSLIYWKAHAKALQFPSFRIIRQFLVASSAKLAWRDSHERH
jgi:hypothetical protein